LSGELIQMLDRVSKEPPRPDDASREIEMAPELMNLHGTWSAGILPATDA
jgi:hypothetical protein